VEVDGDLVLLLGGHLDQPLQVGPHQRAAPEHLGEGEDPESGDDRGNENSNA
jgi:hypothetical protein